MSDSDSQTERSGYEPLTLPPCRVCGGVASGLHYGVNTCEACKAFFRRAIVEKDKYQCPSKGNCIITDKKRGNCSACRLQKCVASGMSRNAVRHGRYTVAIRTKTILEVKNLSTKKEPAKFKIEPDIDSGLESRSSGGSDSSLSPLTHSGGNDSAFSPLTQLSDSDSVLSPFTNLEFNESLDFLTDNFTSSDDFKLVGQQEMETLDLHTSDQPIRKSARIAARRQTSIEAFTETKDIVKMDYTDAVPTYDLTKLEMDDIIIALVTAQDIIYPDFINSFNKEYVEKLQSEVLEKHRLEKEIFGIEMKLSQEEYKSVYLATGIDVDGRMEMLQKAIENIQKGISKFIAFAKYIPGFQELSTDDKLALIKSSRFEYWLMGQYLNINPDLGISVCPDTKVNITLDDCKMMFGEACTADFVMEFCRSLQRLKLTYEEIAILRGIIITFRDRCKLETPDKVEAMQWKLIQCLKYQISKSHPGEEKRRFTMYMDRLIGMRDLTEMNLKCNGQLEKFQLSVIKNYPLVYECVSHDIREATSMVTE